MPRKTATTQPYISGSEQVVVVFSQDDFSALNTLLSCVSGQPDLIKAVSRENSFGLGVNQVEALAGLWEKLHGLTLPAKA